MRIAGNVTASATRVEVWTCDGNASQQWRVVDDYIVNPGPGLCLAASAAVADAGVTVEVCGSAPGQRWTLPPAV
jgi:hypothetical protein